MYKLQFLVILFSVVQLSCLVASVAAQRSRNNTSKWQTLNGDSPLVIARGGFSGIFPDSGQFAYIQAVQVGLPNVVIWCDVQLTKDGFGICFPDLRLENGSDIDNHDIFKNRQKTYPVNGVPMAGWFSVDFTLDDLKIVNLKQGLFSRAPNFDSTLQQILTVEDVVKLAKPPGLWLNVQHDAFFNQHNLTMRTFIISVSRRVVINYISSPEVNFLRSIIARFRSPTKLIFQFMGHDDVEPSTNQTYGSLLRNLTFIKTFASGILVPKNYIWPENGLYLRPHTPVVSIAHKAGLEVFASNFVNDAALPYNYSYDPVAEYLNYIDNGNFSVDGVLSDFPITPSEAIDCFSHIGKNEKEQVKLLVISSEGASGDYPGCTDKAYIKAISDGVDVLDCPVQMTNDRIAFCLGSINLIDRTNAAETDLANMATSNPDLKIDSGVYTYNLKWSEIKSTVKPAIYSPYVNFSFYRNPEAINDGNFTQLSDFLSLASNASSVSGVLISIENAAYLAEKQGLDVIEAVLDALSKAGYNNQTAKKIMVKSKDSAVLNKFKNSSNYELVYMVDEDIRDITNSTISEIKKFARSVVITRRSVFPTHKAFLTTQTDVVSKFQAFGFRVYVQRFRNEFASQPWDFYSDPYVEINTHVSLVGIDGVITDFPATAAKYKRNRCLGYKDLPLYMSPVPPGGLIQLMSPRDLPPAEAPYPVLSENDVVEPPLPPVVAKPPALTPTPTLTPNNGNSSIAPGSTPRNGQPTIVASMILSSIAVLATLLLC